MRYIHFIVNPISGKGEGKITKNFLLQYFSAADYKIEVDFSDYKKHAIGLTEAAVLQKPDIIVACGGDGTIHEVASVLVNSEIPLGIIPIGFGNGLASNLKIEKQIEKAIKIIQRGSPSPIDVGLADGKYFFSNMGMGIDAMIIKKYENLEQRSLSTYMKSSLLSIFQYKPSVCHIYFGGKTVKAEPFLLFISNSNEMGYNMSLTPKASLQDGLLDLMVISKVNFFEKLYFGLLVMLRKPHFFSKYKHFLVKDMSVKYRRKTVIEMQLDGEYYTIESNTLSISVLPGALNVIVD
ncbi:diacylglycerol/lipid kinase family protein [Flavobacterium sp. 3HN19-14]|uniref:diacylglycerol/lipid kinase family protein n=1 Tax=Flavobacterium sp. 3HN19-14 TaxID=3448133 RepID=UPI003EE28A64